MPTQREVIYYVRWAESWTKARGNRSPDATTAFFHALIPKRATCHNRQDISIQRKEDTGEGMRESDPPIVVGDGNGHKTKERAGRQR